MITKNKTKVGDPFYKSKLWRNVRSQIIGRDNNTCQVCKTMFDSHWLQVDHIVSRKQAPHLAYASTNLRTLCRRCHTRAPTSMGRGPGYVERPFIDSSGFPQDSEWSNINIR